MAKRMGSEAKSSSRRCFTLVKVTTPIPNKAVLPTKFAVAEKHMAGFLPWEDCIHHGRRQKIFSGLQAESTASRVGAIAIFEVWGSTCGGGGGPRPQRRLGGVAGRA